MVKQNSTTIKLDKKCTMGKLLNWHKLQIYKLHTQRKLFYYVMLHFSNYHTMQLKMSRYSKTKSCTSNK